MKEIKNKIAQADIVLIEEPGMFNNLYAELSKGSMTTSEVIDEMQKNGCEIFFFAVRAEIHCAVCFFISFFNSSDLLSNHF